MITPDAFLDVLKKLPPLMQRLTKHHGLVDHGIILEDKYRLNAQQSKTMMELETSIIAQEFPPTAVLEHVNKDMGLDSATAKKFAIDFLGLICLPMQWYIGNVEGIIRELSGDVAAFQAQVMKTFTDLYGQAAGATDQGQTTVPTAPPTVEDGSEPSILHDLTERLTTQHGRAEVLLRMTALSQQIEDEVQAKHISGEIGEGLLHGLNALSYVVNTQDLNSLEVAAIKRRLKSILTNFETAKRS